MTRPDLSHLLYPDARRDAQRRSGFTAPWPIIPLNPDAPGWSPHPPYVDAPRIGQALRTLLGANVPLGPYTRPKGYDWFGRRIEGQSPQTLEEAMELIAPRQRLGFVSAPRFGQPQNPDGSSEGAPVELVLGSEKPVGSLRRYHEMKRQAAQKRAEAEGIEPKVMGTLPRPGNIGLAILADLLLNKGSGDLVRSFVEGHVLGREQVNARAAQKAEAERRRKLAEAGIFDADAQLELDRYNTGRADQQQLLQNVRGAFADAGTIQTVEQLEHWAQTMRSLGVPISKEWEDLIAADIKGNDTQAKSLTQLETYLSLLKDSQGETARDLAKLIFEHSMVLQRVGQEGIEQLKEIASGQLQTGPMSKKEPPVSLPAVMKDLLGATQVYGS